MTAGLGGGAVERRECARPSRPFLAYPWWTVSVRSTMAESQQEALAQSFRAAANSLTVLYRDSVAAEKRAHAHGYAAALDDLLRTVAAQRAETVRTADLVAFLEARLLATRELATVTAPAFPSSGSSSSGSSSQSGGAGALPMSTHAGTRSDAGPERGRPAVAATGPAAMAAGVAAATAAAAGSGGSGSGSWTDAGLTPPQAKRARGRDGSGDGAGGGGGGGGMHIDSPMAANPATAAAAAAAADGGRRFRLV
jgi:hypothetical protein